jgi:HlyD family secretion protein
MKSFALLPLVLYAGLLSGCDWNGPSPDGSGTIECTQVEVAAEVGGRLLKLPTQEGAALRKGDLVARIDPEEHLLRRDEAKALLAQAYAQLELVLAGAREEDVALARAKVREASAAAEAAAADLQRIREVFRQESATRKQMDDAEAAAERTAAAVAAAEHNLARLAAGNRAEEIRVAQAQVEVAKARLATVEEAVADCTVTAPMDGVVTTRSREEGELVGPGTVLITLARLDEVWLSMFVPETRLPYVKLGRPAWVELDGMETRFEGRVSFVSPEAEFTPKNVQTPEQRARLVYRVKVTLPNPDGILKPGMPAQGYITSNE